MDGKNFKLLTEKFSSVWFDCVHISLVLNNDIFVAKVSKIVHTQKKNAVCFLEIPKVEESYLFSSGVSTQ